MVKTLGSMKGAAMKIAQLASFIDTEFLPPEYAQIYQDELSKLRSRRRRCRGRR
jgi:predicted unusual protein kinase regulating ubiquinone biosynthesis (AarF/ABC1/UbiB family)